MKVGDRVIYVDDPSLGGGVILSCTSTSAVARGIVGRWV
jgi:hypothetical protein